MRADLKAVLAENLKFIMDRRELSEGALAKLTGGEVSQKTINNIKNQRQSASLDTLQHLPADVESTPSISKLFRHYTESSAEGRQMISQIAEREAQYTLIKKASGEHDD